MRHCKSKFIIFLIGIFFLTSCNLTRNLWNSEYEETFKDFLVSQDGKYVVFLGDNFHYIFADNSGAIKVLLSWPNRNVLFINAEKTELNIDRKNNVTGYTTIEVLNNKLFPRDEIFLRSMGFTAARGEPLSLKLNLLGARYLPTDLGNYLPHLERVYTIQIHDNTGIFGTAAKVALTPITIAADSIVLFGKIVLAPFRN